VHPVDPLVSCLTFVLSCIRKVTGVKTNTALDQAPHDSMPSGALLRLTARCAALPRAPLNLFERSFELSDDLRYLLQ